MKFKNVNNDRYPLLGPNMKCLLLWGLWQPEGVFKKWYRNVHHLAFLIFFASEIFYLTNTRTIESFIENLNIVIISINGVMKAFTFLYWQKDWIDIIKSVSFLETHQFNLEDHVTTTMVKEYIRKAKRITYVILTLVGIIASFLLLGPYILLLSSENRSQFLNGTARYPEFVHVQVPWNKSKIHGYILTSIVHGFGGYYGAGIVGGFNSTVVALMICFSGQLKLLAENCRRIFRDGDTIVCYEEALKRIRECHKHHLFLVKYSKLLNFLLSPIFFVYLITYSITVCSSVYQFNMTQQTLVQKIWCIQIMLLLMQELFLACWFSSIVFETSENIAYSVFENDWYLFDKHIGSHMLLLTGQLQRTIIFTAGPFSKMQITTFISALKATYSFYALIDATN